MITITSTIAIFPMPVCQSEFFDIDVFSSDVFSDVDSSVQDKSAPRQSIRISWNHLFLSPWVRSSHWLLILYLIV